MYRTPFICSYKELPEYQDETCPSCNQDLRRAIRRSFRDRRIVREEYYFNEKFCSGGRYGFLWLKKCLETRPHLHQSCHRCKAKWIVAPKMPLQQFYVCCPN